MALAGLLGRGVAEWPIRYVDGYRSPPVEAHQRGYRRGLAGLPDTGRSHSETAGHRAGTQVAAGDAAAAERRRATTGSADPLPLCPCTAAALERHAPLAAPSSRRRRSILAGAAAARRGAPADPPDGEAADWLTGHAAETASAAAVPQVPPVDPAGMSAVGAFTALRLFAGALGAEQPQQQRRSARAALRALDSNPPMTEPPGAMLGERRGSRQTG